LEEGQALPSGIRQIDFKICNHLNDTLDLSLLNKNGCPRLFNKYTGGCLEKSEGEIKTLTTMDNCWSTIKLEQYSRTRFSSRAQAQSQLFDFIEVFYRRQRRHSTLGVLFPATFETKNNKL
jgi:transposase InsO family protein